MDLLLDTQILLWALGARSRIPPHMREAIESRTNAVYASAASVWEIVIKASLVKLEISGLDKHFTVHESLDEALAASL